MDHLAVLAEQLVALQAQCRATLRTIGAVTTAAATEQQPPAQGTTPEAPTGLPRMFGRAPQGAPPAQGDRDYSGQAGASVPPTVDPLLQQVRRAAAAGAPDHPDTLCTPEE